MNQQTDNTGGKIAYRPKVTYLILSLVWSVGYPAWAIYVLWNGMDKWPMAGDSMGTTPLLVLGASLWMFSLFALWVMYDGMRNGPPHLREEPSD